MQLLDEVVQLVCVEVDLNPKVQFTFKIEPDVPKVIVSDYRRLKQVIVNLMRNSVKFTR
jgi:signal transduction histidine kinase